MADPLSDIVRLLRPGAVFSKGISGAGRWAVHYAKFGQPGFCAVLEGRCRLAVDGEEPVVLEEGDFVLLSATPAFTMSGMEPAQPVFIDPKADPLPDGAVRYGRQEGAAELRQFGGWFSFASPDAGLLVALLPRMIHIRGVSRLAQLVRLVGEEAAGEEVGRELILERYVEILLIEALRAVPAERTLPGLLRGLADPRLAAALRAMHGDVGRAWTVPDLARVAGMSRSAFFERFARALGTRPMEYLARWRMSLARDMLRHGGHTLDEIAETIGYSCASTFSTAFSRHTGSPPGRFMRQTALSSNA